MSQRQGVNFSYYDRLIFHVIIKISVPDKLRRLVVKYEYGSRTKCYSFDSTYGMIKLKRAYEAWDKDDGFRVLVDRLWPRGISKEKTHLDLWLKDVAPSTELRRWFSHDPNRWQEFKERYLKEIRRKKELISQLVRLEKKHEIITFVYGAKDRKHNNALVLAELLMRVKKI